jgi:hypothetical protein
MDKFPAVVGVWELVVWREQLAWRVEDYIIRIFPFVQLEVAPGSGSERCLCRIAHGGGKLRPVFAQNYAECTSVPALK